MLDKNVSQSTAEVNQLPAVAVTQRNMILRYATLTGYMSVFTKLQACLSDLAINNNILN